MKVVIIGGGGVVGQKLAAELGRRGQLREREIERLTLVDIAVPRAVAAGFPVDLVTADIADPAGAVAAIPAGTDVIFHLAAIVSAHAEAEFDTGMRVNLHGTLNVLERARALGTAPVVVYTSSAAVFGGDVPDPIEDWTATTPQTSYGTQKAVGELLLNDYSRRGFLDGRGFRLPTISVRPGKPNRAASSFMSSIIREPLNGREAVCPVGPEFRHGYLSPRRCVANLIRGAELDAARLGDTRCMMMPGRDWTIAEVVAAMTAVAGEGPAALIRWEDDPAIRRIVSTWRWDYRPTRALQLGLEADASFEDNVRYYIEDDLPHA